MRSPKKNTTKLINLILTPTLFINDNYMFIVFMHILQTQKSFTWHFLFGTFILIIFIIFFEFDFWGFRRFVYFLIKWGFWLYIINELFMFFIQVNLDLFIDFFSKLFKIFIGLFVLILFYSSVCDIIKRSLDVSWDLERFNFLFLKLENWGLFKNGI